jgi:hypothetical protein
MIGRGLSRGAATSWIWTNPNPPFNQITYYGWLWSQPSGVMRWGTNRVSGTAYIGTLTFTTSFTNSMQGGTASEAQGATGDSGGAVFIKNGSTWELAGVMIAVGPGSVEDGQPADTALYGNVTFAADLSQYRDQIVAITRPECANEVDDDGDLLVDWPDDPECDSELDRTELPDQDGDDVGDPLDDCLDLPNPDQLDSNQDGYGNLCDADLDDDGSVGGTDFFELKAVFGKSLEDPGYDPDADFDGDDTVGGTDYFVFKAQYGGAPGPSGLACAGTIPCP